MSDPRHPPSPYSLETLLRPSAVGRLGIIAVVLGAIAAAFAWTGGWLSPGRLDQDRMIDTFEAVNGVHAGFRRNHAKGVCLTGWFDSNGKGARLSTAQVFQPGRIAVFGRFALAGGMPAMPDGPAAVRSMALNFSLTNGEVWRTGMNDIPVFPVSSAQAFHDLLVATKPGADGKPDPAQVAAFVAAWPDSAQALGLLKGVTFSSGFANATYNSLVTFRMVDASGHSTPVRWSMKAVDAFAPEPAETPKDPNYLFNALAERVARGPVQWRLILVIGQASDPEKATVPWPADRETVDAGILSVTAIAGEAADNCRDINFDPLVLPSGIEPAADELLSARSAAYSEGFTRRAGERKTPSAVQLGKGG